MEDKSQSHKDITEEPFKTGETAKKTSLMCSKNGEVS